MLNVAVIMGRFPRDPKLEHTEGGNAYTRFSLACERSFVKPGEERETDWIDCIAWKNTAEFITKHFKQGNLIAIDGRIETRSYEDKNGVKRKSFTVVVNNANFAGSKTEDKSKNQQAVAEDLDGIDLPF